MSLGNVDLSREMVQAVREAADILSVASDHTRLAKKGRDWQGLCPLHKEKTPSFHVDPDRGVFYCFGCNAGGDAIKLHMLTTGDDFPAAIEALALRYGVPVRERTRRRRADEPDVEGALAAANEFFRAQLGRHELPRRYLAERKVPPELIERFELGYAPEGWTGLYDALKAKVRERDLEAAGLVGKSSRGSYIDRFRNRLMFPVHNAAGRLVGFGGRTLGDDDAKYVNTAETERFHKGELLYGLFQARRAVRDGGRAVLVEGYFDVIGAVAAGVEGAVATMGTALTPEQARLVARYAEEVVVAYDGDSAGERAHVRALPILLGAGLAVYRARFPEGHDPDSLRLAAGPQAVARAVGEAKDSVVGEIERLATPEARSEPRRQAKAAGDLGELLGRIPDEVLRYTYARRAAERLDLPVEVVMRKVPGGRAAKAAGGPADAAPGPAPPAGARGPGRDVEEKLLRLLLGGFVAPAPPAFAELPPPDAFLDPLCRRLYEPLWHHWRDLGEPCTLGELFEALSDDEPAHAALARLAIEMGTGEATGEPLAPTLSVLHRRHAKRRRAELQRSIDEAHRAGDGERLERLLVERDRLAVEIHPGTRGSVLGRSRQKGDAGRVETE
ncbi:MAG TPA: DNA primase [Thermoanaerobaculia bacterium]